MEDTKMEKMSAFNEDLYSNKQNQNHQDVKVKFQEANLSDDILFEMAMSNDEFARIVLSIVLGKEVTDIQKRSVQKSLPNLPGYKSVRLDVIVKLSDGTLCNVEMQSVNNDDMPKRARFYQGILDTSTLYSGKDVKYRKLPKTVIIFITEFDPFGKGLYKYTFKNECQELPGLQLGDGCTKIFLNTKGEFDNGEPEVLINFLKFVHDSSEENACVNEGLWRLYEIIKAFKGDSEKEREYMNVAAYRADWRAEGEQIGIAKGIVEGKQKLTKLLQILEDSGRHDELSKAIRDEEFQETLFKEFNL